jgi:hypothetical protein
VCSISFSSTTHHALCYWLNELKRQIHMAPSQENRSALLARVAQGIACATQHARGFARRALCVMGLWGIPQRYPLRGAQGALQAAIGRRVRLPLPAKNKTRTAPRCAEAALSEGLGLRSQIRQWPLAFELPDEDSF